MGNNTSHRINEARKRRHQEFKIIYGGLTRIPSSLQTLQFLIKLDLSKNKLETVTGLSSLASLQELILASNEMRDIPHEIALCTTLRALDLSFNHVTEVSEKISSLSNLEVLFLMCNGLKSLPAAVGTLLKLHTLRVDNNNITLFPDTVGNLSNLQKLDIKCNKLSEVPSSFSNLSNLLELRAQCNQFTEIPAQVAHLISLEYLNFNKNLIQDFDHPMLTSLSRLTQLHLSRNSITEIPESIKLLALVQLNLKSNNIQSIRDLEALTSLTELDISYNPVSTVELELKSLPNLQTIIYTQLKHPEMNDSVFKEFHSQSPLNDTQLLRSQAERIKKLQPEKELGFILEVLPQIVELVPNLFVSSRQGAWNYNQLVELGITHIVTSAEELAPTFPNDFNYLKINVSDNPFTSQIAPHFSTSSRFIHSAKEKGGVLVHCQSGVSRSVTLCAAYLMEYHNNTLHDALQFIKSRRPIAQPNLGFMDQLEQFQKELNTKKKQSNS